jgi:Putative adhesin
MPPATVALLGLNLLMGGFVSPVMKLGGLHMYKPLMLGLALAGFALGASAPAHADDWNKKYTVSGKPDIRVETDDGDVNVTTGSGGEINVHVSTSGYKIGPSDVHVIESQDGNKLQLIVKAPHGHFGWFSVGSHSIKIQVQVPAEADLDIHSGDGNVTSTAVSGAIRIDTGDGHITAQGLRGDIHLHSGDGHIEGSNFDGKLDVDTGDGHITISGRFDSLYLKTGDGSISASAASGSKIATPWNLRSGDGSITLRIPNDFAADLDAHTGDGHINLDFPVTVSGSLSESRVRGKMNGGGGTLEINSGDGSIHIQKL